jgi:hypothetical protein
MPILLLADGGEQTFSILAARSTVAEVGEKIGESLGNRIAARDDLAVLVDEVQSRVAPGIPTGRAEDIVESMISH